MTYIHRSRAALAVALTAALLAACGNDTSGEGATGGDGDTSGDSSGQTSSIDGDTASNGKWDGETLTADNFGERVFAAQKKEGTYELEITQTAAGKQTTSEAEGRISGDTAEVHSITDLGTETLESIVTGGYFYLKSPSLGTDKPWLKIDPKAKTGMGQLIGQFGGNSDPAKMSEMFAKAVALKTDNSVEEVDDLDTRKYELSLPSAVLSTQMGMPKEIIGMLPKTIEYTVWVDEQDLIRKMTMNLEIMDQKSETEILFSDYGEDVEIEAPPADQTTTKQPKMPAMPGAVG